MLVALKTFFVVATECATFVWSFAMRSYLLISLVLLSWLCAQAHVGHRGAHTHGASVLCRNCGATLFDGAAHLTGTVLHGPRVASVEPEPLLGLGGALHELHKMGKSGRSGTIKVATFDVPHMDASEGMSVVVKNAVKVGIFGGYSQRLASCSRCDVPMGWHFVRNGAGDGVGEGAGAHVAEPEPSSDSDVKTPPSVPAAADADNQPCGVRCLILAESGSVPFSEEMVKERLLPVLRAITRTPAPVVVEGGITGKISMLHKSGCLVLPRGWWTFRYCPDVGVDQFHIDPTSANGLTETRWSMGEAVQHKGDLPSAQGQGHKRMQVRRARNVTHEARRSPCQTASARRGFALGVVVLRSAWR